MHGYELRKRLNLMLGWGRVLSYGSLYPTLKKMLRSNLIEEASTTVTPVSRRPRIVYQVTEAGTAEFERLMSEVGPAAWEDDNFDIRFAFFSSTDMEIRLRVLEGRRIRLQERLDRVQSQLSLTEKEVDRYAAELQRHGVESVEREVRWLSDLINAERSAGSAPGPSPGSTHGDPPRHQTCPRTASRPPTTTSSDPRSSDKKGIPHGFGSSSNRGGRQLRDLPDPGRRVLQGR